MQTQEPNTLFCEEEERQKQARIEALEEMYNAAAMWLSSIRKLLAAEGKNIREKHER